MRTSQTMREAFIAELMGDLDALITKTEELKTSLPLAGDEAAKKIFLSVNTIIAGIEKNTRQLQNNLSQDISIMVQDIRKAAKEAKAAAIIIDKAGKRFALLALLTGLCGGVLSGVLVSLTVATLMLR